MPRWSLKRGISKVVDLFCGYGEEPFRLVMFSLLLIFLAVLWSICSGYDFTKPFV